jgi:hypothetical protein
MTLSYLTHSYTTMHVPHSLGSLCCLINHPLSFTIAAIVITVAFINCLVMCTRAEFKQGGLYSIWTNPNEGTKTFENRMKDGAIDYAKNNPDKVASMAKAGVNYAKENPEVAAAGFNAAKDAAADDDWN